MHTEYHVQNEQRTFRLIKFYNFFKIDKNIDVKI